MELTQEKSVLPAGKAWRALIYRALAPMSPQVVDKLKLWQIGGLLKTDMQPPEIDAQEEADRILQSRMDAVTARQKSKAEGDAASPPSPV